MGGGGRRARAARVGRALGHGPNAFGRGASYNLRRCHRRRGHRDRPRGGRARTRDGATPGCDCRDALRVRPRLRLPAGSDALHARHALLVGDRLHAAPGRPCARGHLLSNRKPARENVGRSRGRLSVPLPARHVHLRAFVSLRVAILGDPRTLARDQRHSLCLRPEDVHSRFAALLYAQGLSLAIRDLRILAGLDLRAPEKA